MFEILSGILSDKKGGIVFKCFSAWHLLIIAVFAAIAVFLYLYIKNKGSQKAKKVIDWVINTAFGLYILDFFLMPLAYGEIDIEKLPFHVCTAMCVMCFLSRHNKFLSKFKLQFAMLGFLANFIYLIYPAGVMWHAVHPLSYRVVQTLIFHGVMAVYGVLVLLCESDTFEWKKCYHDLVVLSAMTLWALIGNAVYNSELKLYNWFFVIRDPFYAIEENIAPYIMPFLNITVFFIAELAIYFVFIKIIKGFRKSGSISK